MTEILINLFISWGPPLLLTFIFLVFMKRHQKTISIVVEQKELVERVAKATERIAASLEQAAQNQKK